MSTLKFGVAFITFAALEIAALRYCDDRWWHISERNAAAQDAQLKAQCAAYFGVPKP